MPEGDSTYRAASALRIALSGKTVSRFESERLVGPAPREHAAIEQVKSFGNHIEIIFDDGVVLHTHFRFRGGWHLYRSGQKWRKRRHLARVIIETQGWVAVAFGASTIETYRELDQSRHPRAGRHGPDVSLVDADLHECASRLFHFDNPNATIADALSDTRVMSGIGNVYRCESLWACGIHPWAKVSDVPQSTCLDLVLASASLLRGNIQSPTRTTIPDVPSGLAVYGRNGQKCSRCGEIIQVSSMGNNNRAVYWCSGCQVGCEPYPDVDNSDPIARAMDPHPASVKFVSEILRHRSAS